MWIEGFMIV